MNSRLMFVIALLILLGSTLKGPVLTGDCVALAQGNNCCPCPVQPLTPLTDPIAQQFEAGNRIDRTGLTQAMQTATNCFENAVNNAGGNFALNSAFRPPQYQAHLQEIWDKRAALRRVRGAQRRQNCAQLRQQVEAEFQNHQLMPRQRPANDNGPQTRGEAIDVPIFGMGLPVAQVFQLAAGCNLQRPFPAADPVHFQHR